MTRTPATVRRATATDLAAVVELIRIGDARDYDDADVERFIQRLDPSYAQAWIAVADDRPVGMSMFYRRTLLAGEDRYASGYWANLYVDPDHRDQMLYPRLPQAMFEVVTRGPLDFIYALVRRQNLIAAHQRIGAVRIADLPVLIKPLRPAVFLAKYKRWPGVCRVAARPVDRVYAGYLRLRRPTPPSDVTIDIIPWESDGLADFAGLLNETLDGRIGRDWTVESLRGRYAASLDGDPYVLLTVRRADRLSAAGVFRLTDRDHSLRVGVIMDLAWRAGDENGARVVLAEIERRTYRDGAEAVMFLDGLGEPARALVTRAGFVPSPEIFTLVLWPKKMLADRPALATIARWRLSFGDHDAF